MFAPMPDRRSFDVLIVGGGPAGIAAACAASECGRLVGVVDDNPVAGGQIWRGGAPSRQAAHWMERFRNARAELLAETCVIDQPESGALLAESIELRYGKLILATGARERFLPFPGWTLPNIMGAGGLQALVKGGLPIDGKRVVVAGTGPLLLAVGAYLRKHSAEISVIAEQASWGRLARFAFALAPGKLLQAVSLKLGIRYVTGCWPVSAEGDGKIEAVILRAGNKIWRERCDYLACGFGLTPNLELPVLLGCAIQNGFVTVNEWQETSVAGVYCAGEPTGIGGLESALIEGEIAGYAAAGRVDRTRQRTCRFKPALDRAFTLREELKSLPKPETIVCRCEDVPLGRIQAHHSWRSAKLQTRCGMGPCQGRVCGPAIEFLLGWQPESVRPPIFPARLKDLSF
jgi:NADPH-dependent 2,4-dienoyl-CoA reductase/sulfur reductase-like enzyme